MSINLLSWILVASVLPTIWILWGEKKLVLLRVCWLSFINKDQTRVFLPSFCSCLHSLNMKPPDNFVSYNNNISSRIQTYFVLKKRFGCPFQPQSTFLPASEHNIVPKFTLVWVTICWIHSNTSDFHNMSQPSWEISLSAPTNSLLSPSKMAFRRF